LGGWGLLCQWLWLLKKASFSPDTFGDQVAFVNSALMPSHISMSSKNLFTVFAWMKFFNFPILFYNRRIYYLLGSFLQVRDQRILPKLGRIRFIFRRNIFSRRLAIS
jgi:hypothetical protein